MIPESAADDLAPGAPCPFLAKEIWVAADGRFNVCCAPNDQRMALGSWICLIFVFSQTFSFANETFVVHTPRDGSWNILDTSCFTVDWYPHPEFLRPCRAPRFVIACAFPRFLIMNPRLFRKLERGPFEGHFERRTVSIAFGDVFHLCVVPGLQHATLATASTSALEC